MTTTTDRSTSRTSALRRLYGKKLLTSGWAGATVECDREFSLPDAAAR